jgi:carboxylate-amine ligase
VKFKPSKALTVGIELEVQIIDRQTFQLTPMSDVIFSELNLPLIQKEFLRSMVEFVSTPHEEPDLAVDEISEAVAKVAE